jgi:hypothetical protein
MDLEYSSFIRYDAVQTATGFSSRRSEGAFCVHREGSPRKVCAWATLSKEEASCSEKFVYAEFAKNKVLILRQVHNYGMALIPFAASFCYCML